MTSKTTAYAHTVGTKGSDNGPYWYQIYYDHGPGDNWQGPYRDKTDAENAAHDEAARRGIDLTWTD